MTADTNGAAHVCISDVENNNDNKDSSSSIFQSSTENDNEEQGSDSKNNNRNFVVKFGSRQSGNQSTLQHSSQSPYSVGVGDAQAYFVSLLLSVSGLAAHAAFKQQQRRQEEEEIKELLKRYASNEERSNNTAESVKSTKTTGSASSVTSSARSTSTAATTGNQDSADTDQDDGETHVLAEFRFRYGCSSLNSLSPASATKNPRARLVVDVPSPGSTIKGASTFLLAPADAATAPLNEDDDDITNNSNNNKVGNSDNEANNSDSEGDGNTNPISPEQQDESPTAAEETTGASELDQEINGQSITEDEKSETVDDTAPTAAAKEPEEKKPSGNTIFCLTPATPTTPLVPPQGHSAEPLATLGLQRVLSMDLTGGSDTSSVVGRILLSLLSGGELAVDESDEDEEREDGVTKSTNTKKSEEGAKGNEEDKEPTEIAEEEANAEVFYRVRMYTKPRTSKVQQFGQPGQDGSEISGAGNAMSHARTTVRKSATAHKPRTKSKQGQEPVVERQTGEEKEEATTDSDEGRETDGGSQTEVQNENMEIKKRNDKAQKERKQVLYRLRVYMKPPSRKSELHQRTVR
ncbi:hypothetical protein PG985_007775 [Apiospora marii]|uniref:uncharacterized protein n=1 Tax=Apiospora marii TaxID=335849 RepID=UPI0031324F52